VPPPPNGCGAPHASPAEGTGEGAPAGQVQNLCGGPPPPPPPHNCSSNPSRKIGTIEFAKGERVEDVAFRAFTKVAEELNYPAPVQQPPTDLRLAFPPST
jgi:hypothetical protein